MEEAKITITSEINYDDLSSYGLNVKVDTESGDTYIMRGETILVSVTHNLKTGKFEVKKRENGELKTILNNLLGKIKKYQEKLQDENYKIEELDKFFYSFVCNDGFRKEEKELYTYDTETRKLFWQFFNKYVKLRFNGDYKKDINIPELIELESTIIDWEIEEEKDESVRKEFETAQFFCYTRQKNRKRGN